MFIWISWHLMDISQINWKKKRKFALDWALLFVYSFVLVANSQNTKYEQLDMMMLIIMHMLPPSSSENVNFRGPFAIEMTVL